ncbi:MAG: hypothetical protein CVV42_15045 [Candidatus Riflebacteria bacterium HGW-Riflebacteria-2]|jgi:hypothetical protein|nr:MAG: hypothetical protein CVV42_15045 [Candidatus Riflebacteria bacterium HGW-Riflebacteria-2]
MNSKRPHAFSCLPTAINLSSSYAHPRSLLLTTVDSALSNIIHLAGLLNLSKKSAHICEICGLSPLYLTVFAALCEHFVFWREL